MTASVSVMLTSPVATSETTIFMPLELFSGMSHWVLFKDVFDVLLNLPGISFIRGLHALVYSSVKTVAMSAMKFVAIICKCSVEQTHFLRLSVCLSLPPSLSLSLSLSVCLCLCLSLSALINCLIMLTIFVCGILVFICVCSIARTDC